jgi:succinate dehydrogenase / fumarate reductase cytochrome b subunit
MLPRMNWLQRYLSSSVGKKQLTALTGLGLAGFLVAHLAGNLQIFKAFGGAEAFNLYSHKLISNPLIYVAEAGLVALFIAHIGLAVRLTRENNAARGPVPYAMVRTRGKPSRRSFASQTMIYSGALVLVFVVLHVKTFKYGEFYEASYAGHEKIRDLYKLVLEKFHEPGYVAWYVVAMVVLGAHLHHALGSLFETFGIDHPRWTPLVLVGTRAVGWLIAVGFALIPLFVDLNVGV